MHSKLRKNANKSKKKFFFKNSGWVSKNAGFHADFKFVEKVLKKCTKKVISKDVTDIFTFSSFTYVRQTCFAYNFFVHFLKTFSTALKSAWHSTFLRPFLIKKKGYVCTFFKLWSQTRLKRRQKSKNVLSKYVLDLNFAPIKRVCVLNFLKKVKFVIPYWTVSRSSEAFTVKGRAASIVSYISILLSLFSSQARQEDGQGRPSILWLLSG